METVNERIKYLRKDVLRLTQEKFAADLHITRSSLSVIEIGKTVTDRNIWAICNRYNLNKQWLQDGTGPIFRELTKEEEISNFLGEVVTSDKDFRKRFISALARLDDDGWDVMEKFIDDIIKEV